MRNAGLIKGGSTENALVCRSDVVFHDNKLEGKRTPAHIG